MSTIARFDPKWSHEQKVDWFCNQVVPNIFADCKATVAEHDKEVAYTKVRLQCNKNSRITVLLIDAPTSRAAIP